MKRERLFDIGQKLGAFELGQLQDFLTVIEIIRRNRVSVGELVEYVQTTPAHPPTLTPTDTGRELVEKYWPRCPDHDIRLSLARIPENDRGLKMRWFCPIYNPDKPDETCGFERLDTRSQEEIMREFYVNQKIELPEAS
jgi:hypothetical protein